MRFLPIQIALLALGSLPGLLASEPGPDSCAPVTIHGSVHQLGSPDPIAGAVIDVDNEGSQAHARSDAHGRFELVLDPGKIALLCHAPGYAPRRAAFSGGPGQAFSASLGLNPSSFSSADEYVVTGHKDRPQAIQSSVSQREIKLIPGSFGDALRAVQTQPGVAVPNDFSGQLLVQGAGPSDNLYLIDNLPWPIPFHFGGIVSTVDPDLLDSVDLYEAGYSARWGGSLAAVLDAKTKEPDRDRIHLNSDISLLEADASVEGPLGDGGTTFSLAGRRSYFEVLGAALKIGAVPSYWDSGASLNVKINQDNRIHILALASDDSLSFVSDSSGDSGSADSSNFSGQIHYNQDFQTIGASWVNTALPGFVSTLSPYVSHTDSTIGFDDLVSNTYKTSYGLKEESVWQAGRWLGAKHEIGLGGGIEVSDYSFEGVFPRITSTANTGYNDLTSLPTVASTVQAQGRNSAAYLQDRLQLGQAWAVVLGLHYDSSSLVAEDHLGPRASIEWKAAYDTKLTAAWGLYDQAPSALNVNPQYGNPGLQSQEAQHAALSLEHSFSQALSGKIDAYYKTLSDLVVSDPANPDIYDNAGAGDVKGVDLYLKEDLGERFFGWVSYSLSNSERLMLPSQGWSLYEYDQPDILNVVASYSPSTAWTLGAKLRYNSGPLVQPVGSDQYSERLADYMRLDIRADRTVRFQTWSLKFYIEILNLLGRSNPAMEFVNSKGQTQTVSDLPRLPNAGLELKY